MRKETGAAVFAWLLSIIVFAVVAKQLHMSYATMVADFALLVAAINYFGENGD